MHHHSLMADSNIWFLPNHLYNGEHLVILVEKGSRRTSIIFARELTSSLLLWERIMPWAVGVSWTGVHAVYCSIDKFLNRCADQFYYDEALCTTDSFLETQTRIDTKTDLGVMALNRNRTTPHDNRFLLFSRRCGGRCDPIHVLSARCF